ncbi:MAG: UDP-glucose 4-epimerase, partial [Acidimicrobiaceae bacterium]
LLDGIDHVVLCASGALPAASVSDPAGDLLGTLLPLLTVLEALRGRRDIGLTMLSSGGTVYGAPRYEPVDEDHPLEPVVPYGISRMAAERYLTFYAQTRGVAARVLRLGNVYGPGQPPHRGQGVVAALLDAALHDSPVPLYGDGAIARDYVHVDDVVDVVLRLGPPSPALEILNVGTGTATSLREVIDLVEATTGHVLSLSSHPSRPYDVPSIALDITRLVDRIDFRPRPLREGMRQTWAALLDQHRDQDLTATAV